MSIGCYLYKSSGHSRQNEARRRRRSPLVSAAFVVLTARQAFLLERHLAAVLLEHLLELLRVLLGDVLLDRLGRAFDEVLRLFQTEAGDLADDLDDGDLLSRVIAVKLDGEFGLFGGLLGSRRTSAGATGRHDDAARGRLDLVLLFQVVFQLD